MPTHEPHHRLTKLLGRGSPGAAARPEFDVCAELLALVRALAPAAGLRRETWEDSPAGLSICVGNDFGIVLGLDFPRGEQAGPRGAWIRSQRDSGAVHWRLGRQQADWLWLLLTAREAGLNGTSTAVR
jgi:hypothetical protein